MAKLWKKPENLSSWRKISVGMWKRPADPTIYGYETVEVEALTEYLDEVSEACGEKVTLTVFLVKAFSDVLKEHPKLNSIVVGNRVLQRKSIDAFCQVAVAFTVVDPTVAWLTALVGASAGPTWIVYALGLLLAVVVGAVGYVLTLVLTAF